MGAGVSAGHSNNELVDNLMEAHYIKTPLVEHVFRLVDRAEYFLKSERENAYRDMAWKRGNLHISAPCIYSEVMEALDLAPGLSFLNCGSGTGYISTMVGLILGSNGINHGIEYHSDVIRYANKKLKKFKKYSGALDEIEDEFCEPNFVLGNCLSIASGSQQYDRVYCAASCPSSYLNYLKNLLKIQGILVVPYDDHLLQIKRESEVVWSSKALLPVSFATLLHPRPDEPAVNLPEIRHLPPLQELCRRVIRNILRKTVKNEDKLFKDNDKYAIYFSLPFFARSKVLIENNKAKNVVRQINVEDSDDNDDNMEGSDDNIKRNFSDSSDSMEDRVSEYSSDDDNTNNDNRSNDNDSDDNAASETARQNEVIANNVLVRMGMSRDDFRNMLRPKKLMLPWNHFRAERNSAYLRRNQKLVKKSTARQGSDILPDCISIGSSGESIHTHKDSGLGYEVVDYFPSSSSTSSSTSTPSLSNECEMNKDDIVKRQRKWKQFWSSEKMRHMHISDMSSVMETKIDYLPLPTLLKEYVNLNRKLKV